MDKLQEIFRQAFTDGWFPFFMVAGGGKPKPNTIRLVEVMLILGFLWWRIDAVEVNLNRRMEEHNKSHVRIETEINRNRQGLNDIVKSVYKIEGILDAE